MTEELPESSSRRGRSSADGASPRAEEVPAASPPATAVRRNGAAPDRDVSTVRSEAGPPRSPVLRPGAFATLSVPGYWRLWASGWLWNVSRWLAVFLCSYLVNQLSHAPLLVQFVGAAFFAPMFFAGVLSGAISDRLDRRRTILIQLLALIPIALVLAAVVLAGMVRVWMVYPFMLAVGLGGVFDMTSRRALIWDFVGPRYVTNALALEALSMTAGSMFGTLTGGAVIDAVGIGQAFLIIPLCYAASFVLLLSIKAPPHIRQEGATTRVIADLLSGFKLARHDRALVSILGTTVLMNLFYFTYTPMIPIFSERLAANSFFTGVLASGSAIGSLLASFVIASWSPRLCGKVYIGGSMIALLFLFVFGAVTLYPLAIGALMLSGVGSAGFNTMQSVLVMSSSSAQMRGRAMGLLSMAIGVQPFAMIILGVVAQKTGAPAAVVGSVVCGVLTMGIWNLRRPEAWRLVYQS